MMNTFYKSITYQDNTWLGAAIGVLFEFGMITLFGVILFFIME